MFGDRTYLMRRLDEEIAAAESANCAEARAAHRQLAKEFERKLRALDEPRATLTLTSSDDRSVAT
ncbi:hypothetical protein ACFB49_30620 [Sphingomonas sp. DBB INV C78]|uniref:hypothetical protein n=1 Tax=Sphingomonas sp. DBB INV C78 TaxID=3349434 RepID=UPI0036D3059C